MCRGAIGADNFLPNKGTEDFFSCLSRQALEASCKDTTVLPRARVKETRAALVAHFAEGRFVHPTALFAPDLAELTSWLLSNQSDEDQEANGSPSAGDGEHDEAVFQEAAE